MREVIEVILLCKSSPDFELTRTTKKLTPTKNQWNLWLGFYESANLFMKSH